MNSLSLSILLVAVTLAGAGSLVLQLVSARLLTPLTGAGVSAWTAVIALSLTGSALGSFQGARRVRAGRRGVARDFLLGAIFAASMAGLIPLLEFVGLARALPLLPRTLVLAALTAFPAAYALAVPIPLVIERLARGQQAGGRAAGTAFALTTIGALGGVWLAGFVLIPTLTLDAIILGTAAALLLCAGAIAFVGESSSAHQDEPLPQSPVAAAGQMTGNRAAIIAFLASFCLLTLELVAARLMARDLGGSLATWSGVIGITLAGSAIGNAVGGWRADRVAAQDPAAGPLRLSNGLVVTGLSLVMILVVAALTSQSESLGEWLEGRNLFTQVLLRAAMLFFVPAFLLGTVSPQLVRCCGGGGSVAGRVAAWGSLGAVAGTLLTGGLFLGTIGAQAMPLVAAVLVVGAAALAAPLWQRPIALVTASLVVGAAGIGGTFIQSDPTVIRESDYATIRVEPMEDSDDVRVLLLDKLIHSYVKPSQPSYLHYRHEIIQLEFLRAAPDPARVLVIGGGGYTFPRAARTLVPSAEVTVVEIDPAVTAAAFQHLGLDPALEIIIHHADGRYFLEELASPHHYDLVTLDAVNDLSVPPHLLTRECAQAAKRTLTPDGVYLVSVIDMLNQGELWPAALATLQTEFRHVHLLQHNVSTDPNLRAVYVIYASDEPLNMIKLQSAQPADHPVLTTQLAGKQWVDAGLARHSLLLTDQFTPVDQLMRPVYRKR